MHQKPFADFLDKVSSNLEGKPLKSESNKRLSQVLLQFILLEFYKSDLLSCLLSCPSVRSAAPAAAEHRVTLPASLPELPGTGTACPGQGWAPLGPRHHHPTSPHWHSLQRGRKDRDNLKAPEHTCQTSTQTYTHLSTQGVIWTTVMLNIRNKT